MTVPVVDEHRFGVTELERAHVDDTRGQLLAALLYGTGLRLLEGLQLRVKDLDFGHQALIVRQGKGRRTGW